MHSPKTSAFSRLKVPFLLPLVLLLASCQGPSGSSGNWSQNPEFIKARDNLFRQVAGQSVHAQWVNAQRTDSLMPDFTKPAGSTRISSNIIDESTTEDTHYSNCSISADAVFHVKGTETTKHTHWAGASGELAVDIPIRKVMQVFVHNHEFSDAANQLSRKETEKIMGNLSGIKDISRRTLEENVTNTWSVEFVMGSGKKSADYNRLRFSSHARAESFVAAWHAMVAQMK